VTEGFKLSFQQHSTVKLGNVDELSTISDVALRLREHQLIEYEAVTIARSRLAFALTMI
jgi:hypothetical protein